MSIDRVAELEAENAILREQVEVGVVKYLGLTQTLTEQAAVHRTRGILLERETRRSAKNVTNVVIIGRRLDGVRQELIARAEAAESVLRDIVEATGRLEATDGSSDALFGVLDMRSRACTLLGIEAS